MALVHYVVSVYRPGYLPVGDPYTTTDRDGAIGVLGSEIRDTIDAIADDGEFLEADTALHVADVPGKAREALTLEGCYYYDVAEYRHSIEEYAL